MFSIIVTVVEMFLSLIFYSSIICIKAHMLLGIVDIILQISFNPLLGNVIKDGRLMTSSLTSWTSNKGYYSLICSEIVIIYCGKEN